MNLRQHKRRHARKLATRPRYRIRYSTPASAMVNITIQWLTAPACRPEQEGRLFA